MAPESTYATPGDTAGERRDPGPAATTGPSPADGTAPPGTAPRDAARPTTTASTLQETEVLILRARIATLERAVAQKERERDAVVDRYEQILSRHGEAETAVDDGAVDISIESASTTADGEGVRARLRSALDRLRP